MTWCRHGLRTSCSSEPLSDLPGRLAGVWNSLPACIISPRFLRVETRHRLSFQHHLEEEKLLGFLNELREVFGTHLLFLSAWFYGRY